MRCCLIALVLFALNPAFAGDSVFVRGAGSSTCARFAAEYAKAPKFVERLYFGWAQGFMSAQNGHDLNGAETKGFRDIGGDIKGQMSHIRRYCSAHPADEYWQAVVDLFASLPERQMPR
jgi:hypothetical protein